MQKPKPVKNKQSQKQCFIETAKKLEADESGKSFEKVFAKIVPPKNRSSQKPSAQ